MSVCAYIYICVCVCVCVCVCEYVVFWHMFARTSSRRFEGGSGLPSGSRGDMPSHEQLQDLKGLGFRVQNFLGTRVEADALPHTGSATLQKPPAPFKIPGP